MTRKKFIKQLMAMGFKRNSARRLAATANAEGLAYQDAYDKAMEITFVRLLQRAIGESLAGAAIVAGAAGGLHFAGPAKTIIHEVHPYAAYQSRAALFVGASPLIPPVIACNPLTEEERT